MYSRGNFNLQTHYSQRTQRLHLLWWPAALSTEAYTVTVSPIQINPDSFDKEVIWRVVHGFYSRKEYPTLYTVLEKLGVFPGGRFCLWRVLQEMGISYKKKRQQKIPLWAAKHNWTKMYVPTNNMEIQTWQHIQYSVHWWNMGECTSY